MVVSARIGNSIEYYDFLLYGCEKRKRAGPFHGASPWLQRYLLLHPVSAHEGFALPAAGRAYFWQQGDTLGRKNTLLITLGDGRGRVSHRLPAFLRQYRRAGACFTGYSAFSAGIYGWRRMGGAMLMVVEYAAGKHQGRLSALSQTEDSRDNYWRQACYSRDQYRKGVVHHGDGVFLFCSVRFYGAAGLYMRHRLDETPTSSVRLKAAGRVIGGKEERPVVKVVRGTMARHLLIIILRCGKRSLFLPASSRFSRA